MTTERLLLTSPDSDPVSVGDQVSGSLDYMALRCETNRLYRK
ncbi:hypothetical protein [Emticicia sp. BO119]|nr:hypothetical protein [Emticicia sp. BO119]